MLALHEFQSLFDGGARVTAAILLDAAIRGTVLLLLAGGLTLALRRAAASLRHLVWSLAIGGMLVLPALSLVAPEWRVPGLGNVFPVARPPVIQNFIELEPKSVVPKPRPRRRLDDRVMAGRKPAVPTRLTAAAERQLPTRPERPLSPTPIGAIQTGSEPVEGPAVARSTPFAAGGLTVSWTSLIALAWAAGALVLLAAIGLGLLRTWWLATSADAVTDERLVRLVETISAELRLGRRVELLQSGGPRMPMTWGAFRPKILLPAEASRWTERRLRAVLLHELAHVKRYDYATQLLARVACAVHWFNPLAWFAAHRLRVEREVACDDQVLRAGSLASQYARDLLEIARSLRPVPLTSMAGVAMARPSQLSDRLLTVLDPRQSRAAMTPRVLVPVWLGAAFVVLPLAGASSSSQPAATAHTPANDSAQRSAKSLHVDPPRLDGRTSLIVPEPKGPGSSPTAIAGSAKASPAGGPWTTSLAVSRVTPRSLCDWTNLEDQRRSTSIEVNERELRARIKVGDCRLEIEADGEIGFSDDDTDIVSISRGGQFEIEEREGRSRRRLKIEPGRDGTLVREWFVDGDERAYDAEARAWLAEVLLVLFRQAGFDAEARARRILEREGVDGLLQEITFIRSDHSARIYYGVLLSEAELDAATVQQVVRQAGREIRSDFELAQLLITVAENQPMPETVQIAYVEAAESIGSDFEHRRVLLAILRRDDLSAQAASAMIQSATQIGSDFELAELLIEVLRAHPLDESVTPAFFDAVSTIGSDHEQRRVLGVVFEHGVPNQPFLDLALESAQNISSDFELAELLMLVATAYPVEQTMPASYLAAAGTIGSDSQLRRVLSTLVARGNLSPDALAAVLDASVSIRSDFELAELLQTVAGNYALDRESRPAFFRALDTIGSDHDHGRVLRTVMQPSSLDDETVEAVLESAREIGSDFELAELLVDIAHSYPMEGELRDAYMRAVDSIGSRYERERALSALGS